MKQSLVLLLLVLLSFPLPALELDHGPLRLVLHESSGRFSLYAIDGPGRPQALFSDQDPRTSFLTLMVDDRTYRLGNSSVFRPRIGGSIDNPSLIFDSSFMTVTQDFTFVRHPIGGEINGVRVRITLENRGDRLVHAGVRFLLDTHLYEEASSLPFTTNLRSLEGETLFNRSDMDNFWTDSNGRISLSGSLNTGSPEDPDSVHFINWQRLNEAAWKVPYHPGRNFNHLPFSIGDRAVAYFFEPRPLARGESHSFAFTLALNSDDGFRFFPQEPGREIVQNLPDPDRDRDLAELREIITRINERIAAGTATEEELTALEFALNRLRVRYGGDPW